MTEPPVTTPKETRGQAFVRYIIDRCSKNKALGAAMRRADNPAMQHQSWPLLIDFHVDLDKDAERTAFACIGAAVVQSKATGNGKIPLTKALAMAYSGQTDQAASRLRRLLTCSSVEECCSCLRPLFRLIASKSNAQIDYAQLLDDLLWFPSQSEKIKARWATAFYRQDDNEDKS